MYRDQLQSSHLHRILNHAMVTYYAEETTTGGSNS